MAANDEDFNSFSLRVRDKAPNVMNISDINNWGTVTDLYDKYQSYSPQELAHVPNFILPNNNSNSTQLPTRILKLENVADLSSDSLFNLFEDCGNISNCIKFCDMALVFFQTPAMAKKAMVKFLEIFKTQGGIRRIKYAQTIRTSRVWIGGLSPNTTENDINNALQNGEGIKNITWFRTSKEAEVYISYSDKEQAKEAINRIGQDDFALRTSNPSLEFDYADLCCSPLKNQNCQTIKEIGDICMTQIPTVFSIFANCFWQKSAKLHFISGSSTIVKDMMKLDKFNLYIPYQVSSTTVGLDNLLTVNSAMFLGIFKEQSYELQSYLISQGGIGVSFTNTNQGAILFSFIIPPENHLFYYVMHHHFFNFELSDPRNKNFVIVIVQYLFSA